MTQTLPAAGIGSPQPATIGPWSLVAGVGPVPSAVRGQQVPATVPGTVHTDLLAAGLIPDPYVDQNETRTSWIGRTEWRYRTTVTCPAGGWADDERIDLRFEGLDTVCEVHLNGTHLGSPRNMHRSHRYDVTDLLHEGDNDLVVEFGAQLDAAEQASLDLGPRVHVNDHPYNAVRKMACNFGWDWGPALVTAGVWKPVHVTRWRTARFDGVRVLATLDETMGRLVVHADLATAEPDVLARASVRVTVGGVSAQSPARPHTVVEAAVPDASVWWPRGYGDQPLHDVVVTLEADGVVLDTAKRRVGFRNVELDTRPDADGTPFQLRVNGHDVQVKGANWIPEDCFPHRVTRARYAARIDDATDAGMNLLRVWGGGIYESDDFYELCDQAGVLVWQDALFACAAYAEEEPLRGEVVAEVTEAVTRLSSHPSLVLWNGNNENLWGHEDWHWAEQLGSRTWGHGYYLDLLPKLFADLDPTRPYSPGSPWSFDESIYSNDPAHGTTHRWDVWNDLDYRTYRDVVPRFVSEFGYQGPPAWTTLTDAVTDRPLRPTSAGMLAHQKAANGDSKLSRGLAPHLVEPSDFEDWHWAMSVQQARAVSFGIEHFRSWHPVCSGVVVWQLNDCWPVVSWAAVDGAGRRKPLWFALRSAYADRLLTIQPRDTGLWLVLDNDTDEEWDARVHLSRLTFGGQERAMTSASIGVPPRGTRTLHLPEALVTDVDEGREFLVAESGQQRALWFFREDRDLGLHAGWQEISVEPVVGGYDVHLTADTLQRDVCLLIDKVDPGATVDSGMVTVLPGQSHTLHVSSRASLDARQLTDPRVLRSVNQLVHHPTKHQPRREDRS